MRVPIFPSNFSIFNRRPKHFTDVKQIKTRRPKAKAAGTIDKNQWENYRENNYSFITFLCVLCFFVCSLNRIEILIRLQFIAKKDEC